MTWIIQVLDDIMLALLFNLCLQDNKYLRDIKAFRRRKRPKRCDLMDLKSLEMTKLCLEWIIRRHCSGLSAPLRCHGYTTDWKTEHPGAFAPVEHAHPDRNKRRLCAVLARKNIRLHSNINSTERAHFRGFSSQDKKGYDLFAEREAIHKRKHTRPQPHEARNEIKKIWSEDLIRRWRTWNLGTETPIRLRYYSSFFPFFLRLMSKFINMPCVYFYYIMN